MPETNYDGAMPRREPGGQERFDRDDPAFDRAIGFVDATYALALTLLVTTLDVDDPGTAWLDVGSLFDAIGPQFIAFIIAFAVISSYWLQHHRLITSFAAIDYPTIVLNLVLIGSIVLLPFSTQAVGDPAVEGLALPVAFMAANVVLASVLHTLVYLMAARRGLLDERPSRGERTAYAIQSLCPAAVFAISIPVAYIASAEAAELVWLSLVAIKPVAGLYANRIAGPPAA
jgi:uncharacterized membrane protein